MACSFRDWFWLQVLWSDSFIPSISGMDRLGNKATSKKSLGRNCTYLFLSDIFDRLRWIACCFCCLASRFFEIKIGHFLGLMTSKQGLLTKVTLEKNLAVRFMFGFRIYLKAFCRWALPPFGTQLSASCDATFGQSSECYSKCVAPVLSQFRFGSCNPKCNKTKGPVSSAPALRGVCFWSKFPSSP